MGKGGRVQKGKRRAKKLAMPRVNYFLWTEKIIYPGMNSNEKGNERSSGKSEDHDGSKREIQTLGPRGRSAKRGKREKKERGRRLRENMRRSKIFLIHGCVRPGKGTQTEKGETKRRFQSCERGTFEERECGVIQKERSSRQK